MYNRSDTGEHEADELLTCEEGWVFGDDNWTDIYIPDDYDGCLAIGFKNIRYILGGIRKRRLEREGL